MTKINLKKFEKNLVVRPLRLTDWEGVVALQKLCFPGMEPWSKEQFASQLNIFPEGQIGVEYQGKLVGPADRGEQGQDAILLGGRQLAAAHQRHQRLDDALRADRLQRE